MSILFFSSCNKWLDVRSEFDIYEESMFENQFGFYNALNGLYLEMSKELLYGRDLVYGAIEAWGRNYQLTSVSVEDWSDLANFKYENKGPVSLAENIWLKSYFVVSNANNLIQNIENTKVEFMYGDVTKNMIKAEAYAIRALMHFELIRIFAQSPAIDGGGVTAYIPYVDKYPSKTNQPIATKEVLNKIVNDLVKAKELIKQIDIDANCPGYLSFKNTDVKFRLRLNVPEGGYDGMIDAHDIFKYRANRLNYYAITQLLAKVSQYKGDQQAAYTYAKEIIDLVDNGIEGGVRPYMFTPLAYIDNPLITRSAVHPRLHTEVLFGVYKANLLDFTSVYFSETSYNPILINGLNSVFEKDGDRRALTIVNDKFTKFSIDGNTDNVVYMESARDIVPVMRFVEAYYIAAEAIFDTDKSNAVNIFNKLVERRGNLNLYKIDENITKEGFMEAIVSDYRREFLCEGQMVFLYKRLNIPIRDNITLVNHNGRLVLPVPKTEAGV